MHRLPASPPAGLRAGLAAAAVAVAVAVLSPLYGGLAVGDDTFIYMKYVQNYLDGAGFVFNPGEASHGVTSSLWPLLMALVAGGLANTVEVWRGAGIALIALAAAIVFWITRRVSTGPGPALLVTAFWLGDPHTFRWSSSGMENSLAFFSLALLAVAYWRSLTTPGLVHPALAGVAAGAIAFVRPELSLFAAGVGLSLALSGGRPRAVSVFLLAAAAAGLVTAGATWAGFGSLVPQTALAKATQTQTDPLYALRQALVIVGSGAAGSFPLLARSLRSADPVARPLAMAALGAVGATVAYLALHNSLVSTRYAVSLSTPLVVAAALVAAREIEVRRRPSPLVVGATALQLAAAVAVLAYVFPVTRTPETAQIRAFAERARALTPPDARIALTEIGTFGFHAGRYVIDLYGLTDRETLTWVLAHGRPGSPEELEALLAHRRATHYVDPVGQAVPRGARFRFVPVLEQPVIRNNFSIGEDMRHVWRLYRLEDPRPGS